MFVIFFDSITALANLNLQAAYHWLNTTDNLKIYNTTETFLNTYIGGKQYSTLVISALIHVELCFRRIPTNYQWSFYLQPELL